MIWYKELGFYNNPFSIKPAAFHDNLFGQEEIISKIENNIINKKPSIIEAELGEGKTTLLKRLFHDFGGKKKLAYVSAIKPLNIEQVLNERYGFLGRLFGFKAKDIILLIDEAQYLQRSDIEQLKPYLQNGALKSIVFVGRKFDKALASDMIVEHFQLKKLHHEDVIKFIRKRVGELPLLTDTIIKKVFELSDNNPRQLLKNLELLCKSFYESGTIKISEEDIKAFFEKKK